MSGLTPTTANASGGTGPAILTFQGAGQTQIAAGVTLDSDGATPVSFGSFFAANLAALAPLVSSHVAVTQSGSWSVTTSGTATVSGTVAISNLPTTQAVSGTVAISNFPASQVVTLSSTTITGTVAAMQSGTWTTAQGAAGAFPWLVAFSSAQHVIVDAASLGTVAVTGAVTTSGTVTEANSAAILAKLVAAPALDATVATGNASLATVATNTGRLPAQGQALAASSLPVVLPVLQAAALAQDATLTSGTLRGTVALSAGAAAIGSVSVSNLPTTQPVSGTVTANIGTAGTLALEAGGNLATLVTRTPALGQALAASASPVVLPSLQDVVAYAGSGNRISVTDLRLPASFDVAGRLEVGLPSTPNSVDDITAAGHVFVSAACVFYGFMGDNPLTASAYFHIYDSTSAPTAGAKPAWAVTSTVSSAATGSGNAPTGGIKMANGCTGAWSTSKWVFAAGTFSTAGVTKVFTR